MIVKYTPAAISLLPTDTFVEITGGMQQKRGSIIVATFLYKNMTRAVLTSPVFVNSSTPFAFYREEIMPGQNVSCTGVTENQNTGHVTFKFSSGNQTEYDSWDAVGDIANSIDGDPNFAEKLLTMKAYRASPDGSNKTTQVGAMVSVNGLADVPVVYTEPV